LLTTFFLASPSPPPSQPDYLSLVVASGAAIIAAILGALFTYWLTQRQVRRGLIYRIISDTPILSAQKEIEGRIKILFDKSINQESADGTSQKPSVKRPFKSLTGIFNRNSNLREVKDLRLAIVEVQNVGRTSILPGEFLEPLTFSFTGQTEVLDANVVSIEPDDPKPILEPTLHNVTLKPFLLNRNDKVKLKVLAAGIGDIEVSARIVGIEKIVDYRVVERSSRRRNLWIGGMSALIGIILYVVGLVFIFINTPPAPVSPPPSPYVIFILIIGMVFIFSSLVFLFPYLRRSIRRRTSSGSA